MKLYFDLKVKNKKSDVTGISNDKRGNLKYKKIPLCRKGYKLI